MTRKEKDLKKRLKRAARIIKDQKTKIVSYDKMVSGMSGLLILFMNESGKSHRRIPHSDLHGAAKQHLHLDGDHEASIIKVTRREDI